MRSQPFRLNFLLLYAWGVAPILDKIVRGHGFDLSGFSACRAIDDLACWDFKANLSNIMLKLLKAYNLLLTPSLIRRGNYYYLDI